MLDVNKNLKMGTGNFYNVNANKIYAVFMNYEQPILDDDGNETEKVETRSVEEYEVDDFIYNIRDEVEAITKKENLGFSKRISSDRHKLHSYDSTELFQIFDDKKFGDFDVSISINCVARHGYYEGANLDWFIEYQTSSGYVEESIDFIDSINYYSDMPAGMKRIQCNLAERWAERTTEKLITLTEKIFTEHSLPLTVSARFSNGETWYEKAI
jgi:hypothetical protein